MHKQNFTNSNLIHSVSAYVASAAHPAWYVSLIIMAFSASGNESCASGKFTRKIPNPAVSNKTTNRINVDCVQYLGVQQ